MNMRLLPLICLVLTVAAGCATAPPPALTQEQVSKLDFGPYPENYEQLIKDYFAKTLHDPAAAQYRFEKPYTGYLQHGALLGGKVQEAGHFVDVWLKAKTPSGAMAPEKHIVILIRNGEVLMELAEEEISRIKR